MKKLFLATLTGGIVGAVVILLIMFLVDTDKRKKQKGLQLVTTSDSTETNGRKERILVYGDYMSLDSTDYLLIPLGMKTLESQKGLRSKTSAVSSSLDIGATSGYQMYKYNFYALDFENCNNIIFYNKKTEETHLLLEEPAIFSQFYFPYYDKEYKGKRYWFILLGIREDDTNADGYINSDDAEKIYVSDLSGANMIQINPDNTQLVDWYIDSATKSILMKIRYDSNKDLKFNDYDDVDILKTTIDNLAEGRPIINTDIKNNIQGILNKIK